jgi:hypothetical protein
MSHTVPYPLFKLVDTRYALYPPYPTGNAKILSPPMPSPYKGEEIMQPA